MKQASFTIELSLLMPLILLVLLSVFYLDLFAMGRACCTAAACEKALTGREPDSFVPFGTTDIETSVSDTRDKRTVRISGQAAAQWGSFFGRFEREAVYERVYPAQWIRRLRIAAHLTNSVISGGT